MMRTLLLALIVSAAAPLTGCRPSPEDEAKRIVQTLDAVAEEMSRPQREKTATEFAKLDAHAASIKNGMTVAEVHGLLGKPYHTEIDPRDGAEWHAWTQFGDVGNGRENIMVSMFFADGKAERIDLKREPAKDTE
jgi:hypothetical protein